MKAFFAVVLACSLGIALGYGIAVKRLQTAVWVPELDQGDRESEGTSRPSNGPAPKVIVENPEYDFGKLDSSTSQSHDFTFTNAGSAPLSLSLDEVSCLCTMSRLSEEPIPPGKSAKVTIKWQPAAKPGPFEQTARIRTNDPDRPYVYLKITGQLAKAAQLLPYELVFSGVSVGETSTAHARIVCFLKEPLKVLGYEWNKPATAKFFEVAIRPLTVEELKENVSAQSGVDIAVTVKPGLPQGPFRQAITFQTYPATPMPMLAIHGDVASEIAVIGQAWDTDTGLMDVGTVSSSQGARWKLNLVVRGPHRQDTRFKVAKVVPDSLRVSLGERTEINQGAVFQTPLTVEIPPGSPTSNHLGSNQGKYGEITLETTHPQVPTLRIRVRFAVEE